MSDCLAQTFFDTAIMKFRGNPDSSVWRQNEMVKSHETPNTQGESPYFLCPDTGIVLEKLAQGFVPDQNYIRNKAHYGMGFNMHVRAPFMHAVKNGCQDNAKVFLKLSPQLAKQLSFESDVHIYSDIEYSDHYVVMLINDLEELTQQSKRMKKLFGNKMNQMTEILFDDGCVLPIEEAREQYRTLSNTPQSMPNKKIASVTRIHSLGYPRQNDAVAELYASPKQSSLAL